MLEAEPLLREYVEAGATEDEIASRFGVTVRDVSEALTEHGIPVRPPGQRPCAVSLGQLASAAEEGLGGIVRLGDHLGCDAAWLTWLAEHPAVRRSEREPLPWGEGPATRAPGADRGVFRTGTRISPPGRPDDSQARSSVSRGTPSRAHDPPSVRSLLRAYALEGRGLPEVAAMLDVSPTRLRQLFEVYDLPVRPQGLPRRPVDLLAVATHSARRVAATPAEAAWLERVTEAAGRLGLLPEVPPHEHTPQDAADAAVADLVECGSCGGTRPFEPEKACPWCGEVNTARTQPTAAPSLDTRICIACDRLRPHEATERVCVECGPIRGRHGRFSARTGTCCCNTCIDAEVDLRAMVDERMAGETLETVGERRGLTRERVRQIVKRANGGTDPRRALKATVDRELADIERVRAVALASPCVACGGLIPGDASRRVYCSRLCADVATHLRYHVDEAKREKHRAVMRRYNFEKKGREPGYVGVRAGTRYIQPGSAVWHAAMIALRGGWPIAERLPEEIVARDLQPYLETDDAQEHADAH